ncbi:hypothetical protein TWF696_004580 [Orbilia brochopaga]|uniref:Uncharacterized protein n=1 Tax=Orbilia brochopaga TaxID=3140254 RepID=A0AAV9VAG0_9PEZI
MRIKLYHRVAALAIVSFPVVYPFEYNWLTTDDPYYDFKISPRIYRETVTDRPLICRAVPELLGPAPAGDTSALALTGMAVANVPGERPVEWLAFYPRTRARKGCIGIPSLIVHLYPARGTAQVFDLRILEQYIEDYDVGKYQWGSWGELRQIPAQFSSRIPPGATALRSPNSRQRLSSGNFFVYKDVVRVATYPYDAEEDEYYGLDQWGYGKWPIGSLDVELKRGQERLVREPGQLPWPPEIGPEDPGAQGNAILIGDSPLNDPDPDVVEILPVTVADGLNTEGTVEDEIRMTLSRPAQDTNQGNEESQVLTRPPQTNTIPKEEDVVYISSENPRQQSTEVEEELQILSEKPLELPLETGGLGIADDEIDPNIEDVQQQYEQLGPEGLAQEQQAILDSIQANTAQNTAQNTAEDAAQNPNQGPGQDANPARMSLDDVLRDLGITIAVVRGAIDRFGLDLAVGGIQDLLAPRRLQRELNSLTEEEHEELERHPSYGLTPHRLANVLTQLRVRKLLRGIPRDQRAEVIAREAAPAARERLFAREIVSAVMDATTGPTFDTQPEAQAQVVTESEIGIQDGAPAQFEEEAQAPGGMLIESNVVQQIPRTDARGERLDTFVQRIQSDEVLGREITDTDPVAATIMNPVEDNIDYESGLVESGVPVTIPISSEDMRVSNVEPGAIEEEELSESGSEVSQNTVLQNFYGMIDAMQRSSHGLSTEQDPLAEPIEWHLQSANVIGNQRPVTVLQPPPEENIFGPLNLPADNQQQIRPEADTPASNTRYRGQRRGSYRNPNQ